MEINKSILGILIEEVDYVLIVFVIWGECVKWFMREVVKEVCEGLS